MTRHESASKSMYLLKKRLTVKPGQGQDDLEEDDEEYGENRSLFIFNMDSRIRRFCSAIIWWKYFDYIILVLIIVSSILLAIENPLNDPESDL